MALFKLGAKCAICGYSSNPISLHFDHVNGGGVKDLKKHGMKPSYFKKIYYDTDGKYQLLCANCNWGKRVTSGEAKTSVDFELLKYLKAGGCPPTCADYSSFKHLSNSI